MVEIISLQEEVKEDAKELLEIKTEAMKMIQKVENPEYRLLLEERYLCYYSWETIAADLDCTVRNVQILHGKALNSVMGV